MKTVGTPRWLNAVLCTLGLLAAVNATGCQVTVGGQTLPSPHYLDDDLQYFPAGSEFKLAEEAARLKEFKADEALQGR